MKKRLKIDGHVPSKKRLIHYHRYIPLIIRWKNYIQLNKKKMAKHKPYPRREYASMREGKGRRLNQFYPTRLSEPLRRLRWLMLDYTINRRRSGSTIILKLKLIIQPRNIIIACVYHTGDSLSPTASYARCDITPKILHHLLGARRATSTRDFADHSHEIQQFSCDISPAR